MTETLFAWLAEQPDCWSVRLSYDPANIVAEHLYTSLGFVSTGLVDDGEVIVGHLVNEGMTPSVLPELRACGCSPRS